MASTDLIFYKDCLKSQEISQNLKGVEGNNQTSTPANTYRARRYVFVINNYNDEILNKAKNYLISKSQEYIIGLEVGASGTKHIQGYVEFKNQINVKCIYDNITNKMWITKAKGSKKENYNYCSKDNKYYTNMNFKTFQEKLNDKILNEEYENVQWRPFQKEILDLIDTKPDHRKIHWYYNQDGNNGKSYLFKYINLTRNDVIIADGKKDNILYEVSKLIENEIEPRIIILDIPRTHKDFVNYSLIEQLKNGCVQSGKYEGKKCLFRIPHIIITSNYEPSYSAWSMDRYCVKEI